MAKHQEECRHGPIMVTEHTDYMEILHNNVIDFLKDKTLQDLADMADINFDSLKSLIYNRTKDCKLTTAIKLAKALNVSLDELVGADTVDKRTRKMLAMFRRLPECYKSYAEWAIEYQYNACTNKELTDKQVSVFVPEDINGAIKTTNNFIIHDISNMNPSVRQKIMFGIKIVGNYYMPKYIENDIVFIANNRPVVYKDDVVVLKDGYLWIVHPEYKDGEIYYHSLRDDYIIGHRVNPNEIVGYIAHVQRPC